MSIRTWVCRIARDNCFGDPVHTWDARFGGPYFLFGAASNAYLRSLSALPGVVAPKPNP